MQERRIRQLFEFSLLLKGVHALIECLGGLLLAVTSTPTLVALVERLTQQKLIEGRGDFIGRHLIAWSQTFSVGAQHFYAFYLLGHGLVNLAMVVGLMMRKIWAYPASLAVLSLFIAYQLYRYAFTHSVGLLLLTLLDLLVMALVWREYRLMRRQLPTGRAQ